MANVNNLTVQQALEQLVKLKTELDSDQHRERTETRDYGSHDPYKIPLIKCEKCGQYQDVSLVWPEKVKTNIYCGHCCRRIQHPQREEWKAKLHWFKINLKGHSYRDIPLFGVSNLDIHAARRRVSGIRRDLEIRKSIADAEWVVSEIMDIRPPGREYVAKLDCYLTWSMIALALMKLEDGGSQMVKRREYLATKDT